MFNLRSLYHQIELAVCDSDASSPSLSNPSASAGHENFNVWGQRRAYREGRNNIPHRHLDQAHAVKEVLRYQKAKVISGCAEPFVATQLFDEFLIP